MKVELTREEIYMLLNAMRSALEKQPSEPRRLRLEASRKKLLDLMEPWASQI